MQIEQGIYVCGTNNKKICFPALAGYSARDVWFCDSKIIMSSMKVKRQFILSTNGTDNKMTC